MSKAPVVNCPTCGKEHVWDTNNRFRPFCSERCKLIDLGKWANEEYRVEQRERDSGDQGTQA
ncbi:MAG: DNA gyrase inhibitor YacG [Gammaproteobacteria bacterium]|nr:DNA gyrase inhibitor YacG [Gammaproteobacteria bacterium]MBU1482853.1 DNA gyrase inhibitor YacG [Gammaproteobacteria bacterium]